MFRGDAAARRAVRVIGVEADITASRLHEELLREATHRLTVATEAASLGINDYDVASGVINWDARHRELWGVVPDEPITYETFMAGVHPDDRAATQAAVDAALGPQSDGKYRAEYRVIDRRDGRERWIAATARITFVGVKPSRAIGTVQDITNYKHAQDALREADRRKSEFLAVLSHELRNPLAPITYSIHLLDRAAPGSETFVRARNVIARQTEHLARLVDDLLDVVRITRGRVDLQRQRLDLRDLVREAMDGVRPAFVQAGVELKVEPALGPTWLDADPTRIAQVIGNLLNNAQNFTPAGRVVTVSLASDSGKAYLRVKDSGVGMEPGRESEMFDAFVQGDQGLARAKGGLGLGLSLVKLFVEMHGGTLSARSEGKGRGTELVVTLPLAATEAPPSRAGDHPDALVRRILVIEDNDDAAQTLADVLALDGHVVQIAKSGGEGVAMAREHRPELILCDIGLPDIDGYEVARQVRALSGLAHVRLVALTGYALPEDRERAAKAGFNAHLAKPPDPQALAQVLSVES